MGGGSDTGRRQDRQSLLAPLLPCLLLRPFISHALAFLQNRRWRHAEHLADSGIHTGRFTVAGYIGGRVWVHSGHIIPSFPCRYIMGRVEARLFEGCWQRLNRANAHRNAIGEIWNSFIEKDPYGFAIETQLDGNGTLWTWPTRTIPDELSLLIGEMLYQYRAALDGIVYQAAILWSGQDPPPNENQLGFPIARSRKEFENAGRQIAPLPDKCRSMIEAVQPYNAPQLESELVVFNFNRSLGLLNDWARKDRHRRLHVAASLASTANVMIVVPDYVRVVAYECDIINRCLEGRTKIATFRIEGCTPSTQIYANPNLTIDIALNEGPVPCWQNDTLSNRTRAISRVIELLIGSFEQFFEDHGKIPSAAS
jgi:hypothetical protein